MELKDQLKLLVKHQKWAHVATWFTYWENDDELAEKVILWGKLFLPNYFTHTSPPFHKELIKSFFTNQNEYTAAPRGFSKTTVYQVCSMFSIVNKMDKFIVIIEKTHTEATEVLFAIRDEFANNQRILQVYGQLIKKNEKGNISDKSKDTQGDVMINGVRLRAKGFNSAIRGLKSKEWRPTRILVDDVEEDTHITSEDQREKYKANYTQGIIPALDIDGSIKMIGTILHMDSLLMNLIEQHKGRIYKAYDPDNPENTLLWPERWPLELLDAKKKDMMLEGLGSSKFAQEYLNEPVAEEVRAFKWDWLQKTYNSLPENLDIYSCIDSAETVKDKSDYTGEVTVGIDPHHNWYILRAKRHKVNSTGQVDLVYENWDKFNPIVIGVEKASYEDQLAPMIKMRGEQTGKFPVVIPLRHGGKRKEDRIKGALVGRFEAGKILFPKQYNDDCDKLRQELYDFPASKYDDLSDALAYIDQIAQKSSVPEREDPKPSVFNDAYYYKLATEGVQNDEVNVFEDWEELG